MTADPHAFRGAHPADGGVVIRTVRPAAQQVTVYVDGKAVATLEPSGNDGLFEGVVAKAKLPLAYELEVDYGDGTTFRVQDPYRFGPTLGDMDLYLAGEGRHEEIYARLGAHVIEHEGVRGTSFAVWAPAAQAVSVVGDLNYWDPRLHPMRSLGSSGIWELFIPEVGAGTTYKYKITGPDGAQFDKADPYAFEAEVPTKTA
jgi:1,4-alpha-glucan branching enzyme